MFREQLADLIDLDHQRKLDAYSVEGSFAGAIGLPQFMPGSLAKYSADGDADGRIDVETSIPDAMARSEEHTSELQSLMRISYAVFCLKKKKTQEKTDTR